MRRHLDENKAALNGVILRSRLFLYLFRSFTTKMDGLIHGTPGYNTGVLFEFDHLNDWDPVTHDYIYGLYIIGSRNRACWLFGIKSLPETMSTYCSLESQLNSNETKMFLSTIKSFEHAACTISLVLFWPQCFERSSDPKPIWQTVHRHHCKLW